ncbi:MAG: hypothetical protein C4538_07380 [Nitrospiraceae bacterium]|nr:MAG: hypothetical protein C4538_07380 [Nitrospiraceae bacterium]
MVSYVRQQSAGEIIRNSIIIYKSNFLVLFLIYLLPTMPLIVYQQYATHLDQTGHLIISFVLTTVISLLLFPPFTVAVSEICLGNKASVVHSYRRVFDKGLGGFIGTYFLYALLFFGGILLFIIPGIIFIMWYIFTLQIAVLERVFGRMALKRSKELGKGFYWRNFGIFLLLYIVMYAFALLIAMLSGFFLGLLFQAALDNPVTGLLFAFLGAIIGHLFSPLPFVGIVLLYYDMRARKEAYDTAALAEDLMR